MSTAHALAELERSPELFDHIAHLQQVADLERRRREQFHREIPAGTRAEFINGHVVTHPPASRSHAEATAGIARLLGEYARRQGLGEVRVADCLVGCQRNDYAPDVCFFRADEGAASDGGRAVFPPPALAVEVLGPATESNDRALKLHDYARHGIGEYWLVDPEAALVEQYVLPAGARDYALKARVPAAGRLASSVLAGFEVPVGAMFDGEENRRVLSSWR